jgi:hypothetical protein
MTLSTALTFHCTFLWDFMYGLLIDITFQLKL